MKTQIRRVNSRICTALLLAGAAGLFAAPSAADTFGSGVNQFDIDFVTVGNPGNPADTTGAPNPAGAVPYAYRMGVYEVSENLISKATGGGLAGVAFSPSRGANKPATSVSWYEAARFVNWLNTSQGYQAAYNFSGSTFQLWPSSDAWQLGGENLYRHKDAHYFLPTENEWYKAAFYDGNLGVYYDYPTGSDTAPTAVAGGTADGTAVFNQPLSPGPADVNFAGGLSPYGTMGQGGNLWEWMEGAYDGVSDSASEPRGYRGGRWGSPSEWLTSSATYSGIPTGEGDLGFRVAAIVPEPLESASVVGVAALGFALWRRRGSR